MMDGPADIDRRLRDLEVAVARVQTAAEADRTAVRLQAEEYERRLTALNHAHERAVEVQHTYVTADKYEDKLEAELMARNLALTRIDERFTEFVTRYEARQREVDVLIAAQKGAAMEAKRAAEEQGRKAVAATAEATRKTNRNLGIMAIVVTVVIAIANGIGPF